MEYIEWEFIFRKGNIFALAQKVLSAFTKAFAMDPVAFLEVPLQGAKYREENIYNLLLIAPIFNVKEKKDLLFFSHLILN